MIGKGEVGGGRWGVGVGSGVKGVRVAGMWGGWVVGGWGRGAGRVR